MSAGPERREDARRRLYRAYVSTHGTGAQAGHADPWLRHEIPPLLPSDRTARILDVGCGAGDLVALLRSYGYSTVSGVDLSAEQVALAAERGIEGITQQDLFEALAAEPASLDAVVALDVLEHFKPDEVMTVLDEIAGSLRPGGVFIARTPNAVSPFGGRYRYGDLTHGISYTSRSLRQALVAAGFSQPVFRPVNPVAHGLPSALRLAAWLAIAALLKAMLVTETGQVRGHVVTQNLLVTARR